MSVEAASDWRESLFVGADGSAWTVAMDIDDPGVALPDWNVRR